MILEINKTAPQAYLGNSPSKLRTSLPGAFFYLRAVLKTAKVF
jgi:hypothetical protein